MSVVYVVERVLNIVGNALFKPMYSATLLIFKGTTYMCFAGLTAIGLILIM